MRISFGICQRLSVVCLAAGLCAGQTGDDAYGRAAALFRGGKAAEAEAVLRDATRAGSGDPRAWNLLGVVLDSEKAYDEAERCFRKAVQIAPKSPGILNNLGNHYLAAGKPDLALAEFRKVVAIEPGHPNANLQLAKLLVDRKQGKAALDALARLKGPDAGTLEARLLRARGLLLAGLKADSISAFREAEKNAAGGGDWYSIGMAEAAAGEFESAEQSLSRALELAPANADILHDLGVAALRAGHAPRAQQVFETMLRAKPDDAEALFQLGRATAAQGREDDAILVLSQARKLAPTRADIVHTLAVATAKAGFFGDAALAFDDYLKLRPEDETARRERGFAYACAGKTLDALRDLEWYAAKNPNDPQGRFELGFALSPANVEKAIANLNEALRLKRDFPEARFVRGEVYAREGKPEQAVRDLEAAVAARPDHIRAIAALGRVYLDLDRPGDAVRALRTGYAKAPRDPLILMTLGRALTRTGERAEAARMYQEFNKVGPDQSSARVAPGVLALLNLPVEEFDKRYEANLRSTLAARAGDADVRKQLARFLLSRNRKDEALAEYRQLLAASPKADVALECGRNLMEAGEFGLAKQFLAPVAESTAPDGYLDLAIALIGNNEAELAITELNRVPGKDRLGDYYLVQAQAFDALGQVGPASDSLAKALQKAPTRADLYAQAVYFLLRHNRDADALGLVGEAVKQIPNDATLSLLHAALLASEARRDDALAELRRISARWPEWSRPYLLRAIVEQNHNDSENALKDIEAAIAMGERTPEAYYYLADALYHAKPEDIDPARNAIAKSLELDPADPWAQALAGRLAWEAKEFEASVRHLQEAARLKKDFSRAHFWLGITYRSMGNKSGADREFAEVSAIHVRNPNAESEEVAGGRDRLFGIRR